MIPYLCYYQLAILGLLWLCVMQCEMGGIVPGLDAAGIIRKIKVRDLMRGKPNNGFPLLAHHLKTARHFGALNVQVSTQSKILAL